MFGEQAVETVPGALQVFGTALGGEPDEVVSFYFDYDLMAAEAGDVNFISLPSSSEGSTVTGTLSPDGSLVPVYVNALWTDAGSIYGELVLRELATESEIIISPEPIGVFRWQP